MRSQSPSAQLVDRVRARVRERSAGLRSPSPSPASPYDTPQISKSNTEGAREEDEEGGREAVCDKGVGVDHERETERARARAQARETEREPLSFRAGAKSEERSWAFGDLVPLTAENDLDVLDAGWT